MATPSDLIQDKNRTPFNIGKAIELKGFQPHEAQSLAEGLRGKADRPQEALQAILNWTGGQPFLTQKLCQLVAGSPFLIVRENEDSLIAEIVSSCVIENWGAQDKPDHLKTIRERLLNDEQRAGRLLGIYQQILQEGEVDADASSDQMELRLSGLVVEQQGQLKTHNHLYETVFNQDWLDQTLATLRPYASAITAWLDSGRKDEAQLLRGQSLHKALAWAEDKSLSDQDYQFLSASQELEKRNVERAFEAEKQAKTRAEQILGEAQVKARHRILTSSAISVVALIFSGISVFLAQQKIQQVSSEQQVMAEELETVHQDLGVAKRNVDQANSNLRNAKEETRLANKELSSATQKTRTVNQELSRAKADFEKLNQESVEKTAELKSAAQKVDTLENEANIAERRRQQAELRTRIAETNLQQAESSLQAALEQLGTAYFSFGDYESAAQVYEQLLGISQNEEDRLAEGRTRQSLGNTLAARGNYDQAIQNLERSITIAQETETPLIEGRALGDLGLTLYQLGDYDQANNYFERSLDITRKAGDHLGEGRALRNLGLVCISKGEYNEAVEYLRRSLAIAQEMEDHSEEGRSLAALGLAYSSTGEDKQAIEYLQQSLVLMQTLGERSGIGEVLRTLGLANFNLENYQQASIFYNQSLGIWQEIGDRTNEAITLRFIGELFSKQNQPELAITFYKQSFNIIIEIQRRIPIHLRQPFERTFNNGLRSLAALLLEQNRVEEARQIVTSLNVQEQSAYFPQAQVNRTGITLIHPEEEILAAYNELTRNAIEIGQEISILREKFVSGESLTSLEEQRLDQLLQLQSKVEQDFNRFVSTPEIVDRAAQLSSSTLMASIDLSHLSSLQDNLSQLHATLIYPLILDDRLELIIATPDSPPLRRTVLVNRVDLNRAVMSFRQALEDPNSDPFPIAQQLYQLIIQPLENDLATANTKTILYAPDGALRYVPLSALYDGNSWLAQRFNINYITASSLVDWDNRPSEDLHVIAAAFNEDSDGIQSAKKEVEAIANVIPSTTLLLDEQFTEENLISQLRDRRAILHLATQGVIFPGRLEESFIFLGNGIKISLAEIRNWNLSNVDLIVLSGITTGSSGEFGGGEEILGFSYQLQRAGVSAVMASLWSVHDSGTEIFMRNFYAAIAQGMTKAEALRRAQLAMLATGNFSHPYYWAPFILIGNGL